MTNESISGFLNSIAEAKRAFDAEPSYQSQIRDLENDKRRLGDTVAHRELRIHELKQVEETLTQKLRSVEAERDDAGFRALETDDKVQNLLIVVRGFVNDGLKAINAVEGKESIVLGKDDYDAIVKDRDAQLFRANDLEHEVNGLKADFALAQEQLTRPFASATPSSSVEDTDPYFKPYEYPNDMPGQREADPSLASALDPIPQGLDQSETDPTATTTQTAPSASAPSAISQDTAPTMTSASAEGQSEGPFASRPEHGDAASPNTASSKDDASLHASPPERNRDRSTFFKGRKYFDVTYFVPLHKWLEDGGTREDYYWRPAEANVPLPEASQASHRS